MQQLTFEQLPLAVAMLINEVKEMKSLLQNSNQMKLEPANQWFNLEELCVLARPPGQTNSLWLDRKARHSLS